MPTKVEVDASPEKRLFISLLTRDIPLVAAFLDLVDNSINAAVEPFAHRLRSAEEYLELFSDPSIQPNVSISLSISENRVEITDAAGGISSTTARDHVFKFGRGSEPASSTDRLSVYGIGLKRALFKLGNKIAMRSDHVDGGFDLKLDVDKWASTPQERWSFLISPRSPVSASKTGTSIIVTELHEDVRQRISDGLFEGQLRDAIARTYAFYLAKVVSVKVNNHSIEGIGIELGDNHGSSGFEFGAVTCKITAGIGVPEAGAFREKSSGWFVFCNGRAVISADKSPLTGWGAAGGLPSYQPKHRPFLGTVFFVSEKPEQLPWTTTKATINEDSALWQRAKREMASLGRAVVSFLDGRYSDLGTEVTSKDLQEASGSGKISVLSAAVSQPQLFKTPKASQNATTRIQYDALVHDVARIASHLKKPSMSGSDVGRHTFHYFLRNEVGED